MLVNPPMRLLLSQDWGASPRLFSREAVFTIIDSGHASPQNLLYEVGLVPTADVRNMHTNNIITRAT